MKPYILGILCAIMVFSGCNSPTETIETTDVTQNSSPEEKTLCQTTHPTPNIPSGDVLSLMGQERPEAYAFAQEKGAEIVPVDNDRSYVVWWEPEGFNPETDTVLVTLHGHGEWAIKDFEVWYPELEKRGYAILAVQWWFGRSLENEGYYEPDQIDAVIEEALASKNIPEDHVIFQGFSMGSARAYTVTLYDQWCGSNYFGVSIANAGQWEDDYEPHAALLKGDYGEAPFEGTRWILFCGEQDINEYARTSYPNVCEGMEYTRDVLTDWGGIVDLLIKDSEGDHGSFMINSENRTEALNEAEAILEELRQNNEPQS